ncbi:hypothetical protein [Wolbachia endosymbiont (group B) of Athalia cordata]|uniref:hypothetical protein n=1 Tax=Wolbachia endosymbiont (group B) of Athalia cordata TaxID=2953986 RepID=UPI00222FD173|nr:hypothetical protein [Wolbachia endosymbiont (group B) of Athalia cordata]
MTYKKIEKRSISFDATKSKFSNDRFQIDSSSNESIDTIGKKFKYEVKLPGVIHTTTRKNNVGSGLNELDLRKKNENSFKTPIKNIEESDSKRNQSHLLFQEDSFPELPACAYKPALLPKPSKEKIKEAVDKMRNNRKAHNSASVENGVSSDRFKVRPFLCSDIDGYVAPDKRDRNLERCRVTHDSSKLEAQMERKHGFQSDPSVKHVKADTVVCSITKGHDKKGVKSDFSYTQEPTSEMSKVNVRELANRFRG